MPIYIFYCDPCEIEYEESQPMLVEHTFTCPKCEKVARRRYMPVHIDTKGEFHHMKWGKPDKTVCYPDGHSAVKTHDDQYESGGIGSCN